MVFMGFMVFTLFLRTKVNYFQQFRLGTMKGNIKCMITHEVKDMIRTMNVALTCPEGPALWDELTKLGSDFLPSDTCILTLPAFLFLVGPASLDN